MGKWIKSRDGIWPMFISADLRVFVTQHARGDWRWTVYASAVGQTVLRRGISSTEDAAKFDALTSAA